MRKIDDDTDFCWKGSSNSLHILKSLTPRKYLLFAVYYQTLQYSQGLLSLVEVTWRIAGKGPKQSVISVLEQGAVVSFALFLKHKTEILSNVTR